MPLFGLDCSQFNTGVDLHRARGEGIEFFAARVTSAALTPDRHQPGRKAQIDPAWPRFRDEGRALWPDTFSCYHRVGAGQSAEDQAEMFAAHNPDRSIPVFLDHEAGGGQLGHLRACLEAFRRRGYRIYATYLPDWWWVELGEPDLRGLPPLIRSEYPDRRAVPPAEAYGAVREQHWTGYGGLPVVVLQFSGFARAGGHAPLCVDAYRSSRADYARLLGAHTSRRRAFMLLND